MATVSFLVIAIVMCLIWRSNSSDDVQKNHKNHLIIDETELSTSGTQHLNNGFEMEEARRRLAVQINQSSTVTLDSTLTLKYEPLGGFASHTALGIYVNCLRYGAVVDAAKIYYEVSGIVVSPTFDSSYATFDMPYIHLDSPFGSTRNRTLTMVCVVETGSIVRSKVYSAKYFIEAGSRQNSFAFLVPGVESEGKFLRIGIEMKATARAQTSGGQEFAYFSSKLATGTYPSGEGQLAQVQRLNLTDLDADLTGFEGGFAVNTTGARTNGTRHYGFLVPSHNGVRFFGKVVRVDLKAMEYIDSCFSNYRIEYYESGVLKVRGPGKRRSACVFIVDLETINGEARGFRRGFVGYPYAYLSPGEFSVAVRIDTENFHIGTMKVLELADYDKTLGGYSGGFADGTWACFNPFRSFTGPVGGIRSQLPVDKGLIRVYFQSVITCVNKSAWEDHYFGRNSTGVRLFDLSTVQPSLRGFSEAVRVGRYAYFAPLEYTTHQYTSTLVRMYLGVSDIASYYDDLIAGGGKLRDIVDIMDLSQADPGLAGFSGIFTAGKYLFLVPYRNKHEPKIGQRGHGNLARVDMNYFSLETTVFTNLQTTERNQIPSFADSDLAGFSSGFASGQYGLLVPFFNGIFTGKICRFILGTSGTLSSNVQELDLTNDKLYAGQHKGYRGGFASLWDGT